MKYIAETGLKCNLMGLQLKRQHSLIASTVLTCASDRILCALGLWHVFRVYSECCFAWEYVLKAVGVGAHGWVTGLPGFANH